MHATPTSIAFLLCAAVGCGPTAGRRDDGGSTADAPGPTDDGTTSRCQKMDLLFVIDNSFSMDQEQANLIANFPQFIGVLDASGLDYRVAVTTTGRDYQYLASTPLGTIPQRVTGGDNGTLLQPPACGMTKRWLDKADAGPAATFACVANVGTDGPGFEMPLGAMRDAFEDRMTDGTNAGFRRADALLGVVFLTDEEDCSYEQSITLGLGGALCTSMMEPPASYVQFLDAYTGHRSRWATAVIAGMGPGACSSAFGDAVEAKRLAELVTLTGANGVMSSICEGDLALGLRQALATFQSACNDIIL